MTRLHPQRYDNFARALHWLMALGFAWMFSSALAHKFLSDSALDKFLFSTHKTVGFVLLIAVVVRILWALISRNNRPKPVSLVASLGHLGLYALMFAVPTIGLLRQFGSGRPFDVWGIPVMAATPEVTYKWMVDLGGNLHGLLGWVLLAMVIGHIAIAVAHRRNPETNVLPRMWG